MSVYDWGGLAAAQTEALTAVAESRALFRLFFASADTKRGASKLDELEGHLRQLAKPVAERDAPGALEVQTRAMRTLVSLGNLAVGRGFPYQVTKAVRCEGLPRLLGRATVEVVIQRKPPPATSTASS